MSPNHLLPPNATALEKALSLTMARIDDAPVPVDLLFNPDLCPASHLPWLAWALSVDNWNANWPESVKRRVIKSSIEVHRHKGTRGALNAALSALECSAETKEWWEKTPHGEPHTFSVTAWAAKLGALNKERQADILTAIEAVKPVRSHFDHYLGAKGQTQIAFANILTPIVKCVAKAKTVTGIKKGFRVAVNALPAQRLKILSGVS